MSSYKFPPEQNITHECLQQGNILLWHCQKLHKTILLQKEGYLMLKTGLIKEIRLGSWLFRSLSLWPEASSLTSVYLLALTQMSIIAFFSFIFWLLCLWVFSSKACFSLWLQSCWSAHTSTELPMYLLLHTFKTTCCTGKSSYHNKVLNILSYI